MVKKKNRSAACSKQQEKEQPPSPPPQFSRTRIVLQALFLVLVILAVELIVGIWGFKTFFGMNELDALHNSTMYIGGLGPITDTKTNPQKAFSAFYALFASFVFLGVAVFFFTQIADVLFFPNVQI